MNKGEILALLKEQKHKKIKVAIIDIDGIVRGKFMSKNKFISALESKFGFCQVVFGWDMNDACYDNVKVTGWHTGYGDMEAIIDPSTFRTIPWEDDIPFFIADFISLIKISNPFRPKLNPCAVTGCMPTAASPIRANR